MRLRQVCCATCLTLLPLAADAQSALRPEIGGSVAWGHVFRFDDQAFGNEMNLGVVAGARLSRLGLELDLNRTFGLTPASAPCGVATCVGTAREGVLSASVASGNLLLYFGRGGVEPYLSGGIGVLHSRSVHATLTVQDGVGTFSEAESSDTGLAINGGGGVRIHLSPTFSLRPELRLYTASARSTENLALVRASIAAIFAW